MLNARERAELKSMNYSSKQHSGIKNSTLLARQKKWNFPHKKAYWFGTAISYLTILQPFCFITAFYFNSCHLGHYIYIPALITYFSTPPIMYSNLVPVRKHQWGGKCYCETFRGTKGYSSSKNVSATSGFLTGTVPFKCEMWGLMLLKSMPGWAAAASQGRGPGREGFPGHSLSSFAGSTQHRQGCQKQGVPARRGLSHATSVHSITLWSIQGWMTPFVSLHKHCWLLPDTPHPAPARLSGERVHFGG